MQTHSGESMERNNSIRWIDWVLSRFIGGVVCPFSGKGLCFCRRWTGRERSGLLCARGSGRSTSKAGGGGDSALQCAPRRRDVRISARTLEQLLEHERVPREHEEDLVQIVLEHKIRIVVHCGQLHVLFTTHSNILVEQLTLRTGHQGEGNLQ